MLDAGYWMLESSIIVLQGKSEKRARYLGNKELTK
jgi:hypothetical protein